MAQTLIRHSSLRKDALLFSESQSRVIISCSPDNAAKVEALAEQYRTPFQPIGKTGGDKLVIQGLVELPTRKIAETWSGGLEGLIK